MEAHDFSSSGKKTAFFDRKEQKAVDRAACLIPLNSSLPLVYKKKLGFVHEK